MKNRVANFISIDLWKIDVSKLSPLKTIAISFLRFLYLITVEILEGQLAIRAQSLVFTTLLSLVPFLAVTFSMLKAFGIQHAQADTLYNLLTPLGPKASEITGKIIGFVDNIKVGVLGSLGLALLIYTVISVIQKIEDAFNYIWRTKVLRGFFRRFSDYMSTLLVGPLFIYAAIGLTASMKSNAFVQKIESIEVFGTFINVAFQIIPFVFVWLAFTLIYYLVPNTEVKFRSALFGGVTTGVIWQTAGYAFATFVVNSTKQYDAIYSGFAILIMFMIWLYVSWLIILIGGKITFYHQYPEFLTVNETETRLSIREKTRLTLLIVFLIAYHYYHNKRLWTLDYFVKTLKISSEPIEKILELLREKELIAVTAKTPSEYLLTQNIETLKIQELMTMLRHSEDMGLVVADTSTVTQVVESIIDNIERSIDESLGEQTLKDLVLAAKESA
jgi:membrane protein